MSSNGYLILVKISLSKRSINFSFYMLPPKLNNKLCLKFETCLMVYSVFLPEGAICKGIFKHKISTKHSSNHLNQFKLTFQERMNLNE